MVKCKLCIGLCTGWPGGVQILRSQNTSDPRHFGPSEVRTQETLAWPKCPDTSALVPKCLTDTLAPDSTYIEVQSQSQRPTRVPWIADNNLKFDSSGLYRVALSLGGELQSLVLMMSSCSVPAQQLAAEQRSLDTLRTPGPHMWLVCTDSHCRRRTSGPFTVCQHHMVSVI